MTVAADGADGVRRRLFTIAVRGAAGATAFDEGVAVQLAAVEAWWSSPDLGARACVAHHIDGVTSRHDLESALHHAGLRTLGPADVAIVYVTGHGRGGASGRHYLLLPDSPPGRLAGHAYPTRHSKPPMGRPQSVAGTLRPDVPPQPTESPQHITGRGVDQLATHDPGHHDDGIPRRRRPGRQAPSSHRVPPYHGFSRACRIWSDSQVR